MQIAEIRLQNVRIIKEARLYPGSRLNLIIGGNGSGKTTLLEALYLVSHGRSFRTRHIDQLINREGGDMSLFTRIIGGDVIHRVGIERGQGASIYRVDGENVRSGSQLARVVPIKVISPETLQLLTQGAKQRRAHLDWLLFHVEHNYHANWNEYRRVMSQRNVLLKGNQRDTLLEPWTRQLSEIGERVHAFRSQLVAQLDEVFRRMCSRLLAEHGLSLAYQQGWPKEESLGGAQLNARSRDRKYGFTTVGPHRADLVIRDITGRRAMESLSRGQQKLATTAFVLAQISYLATRSGRRAIIAIDDLPSEVDEENRARILSEVVGLGSQTFLTTTDQGLLSCEEIQRGKMFHVKHGRIQETVHRVS